jgi:hypothetical protein
VFLNSCNLSNGGSYLSGEGLSGLESSARDALTRVLNSPDVQNLGEGLRTGVVKVRLYVKGYELSTHCTLAF